MSWLAGLGSYCFVWYRMEGTISTRELSAVMFWSAFAMFPFLMFYAVAVSKLNQSPVEKGPLSYGVVCALIGIFPIALLNLWFGGFSGSLLSSENLLFFAHFGTMGFMFGTLYALFLRVRRAQQQDVTK
jgi:hypothetical protein